MFTVTAEASFCAAHCIEGHPKCGRLHGHNYNVKVVLGHEHIDAHFGFVVDFGEIKKALREFVDQLDHKFIYGSANAARRSEMLNTLSSEEKWYLSVNQTSAESLAEHIYNSLGAYKPFILEVSVWETPTNQATYLPKSS